MNEFARTVGLMNPIGFFPMVIRASLTMVRIAPTTGAEADVPKTRENLPVTWARCQTVILIQFGKATYRNSVVCTSLINRY